MQASPLTGLHSSQTMIEKESKHHDDLANVKKIPSILPDYIPPLVGVVNHKKIPWDYEYTLIIVYIPKGIHVVGSQLGKIPLLKNIEFNLDKRKNYAMLSPHRYLKNKTGKKPCLVSQPWIKEMAQSTMLNVMKIPQFGCHQEVNACVKLLLSCYHGGYMWLDWRITMDLELIHLITGLSMKGPNP